MKTVNCKVSLEYDDELLTLETDMIINDEVYKKLEDKNSAVRQQLMNETFKKWFIEPVQKSVENAKLYTNPKTGEMEYE